MIRKILAFVFILSNYLFVSANGVSGDSLNTRYIQVLSDDIHARMFFSRKYTNLTFSKEGRSQLLYEPNSNLTMGVGVTIKSFSLNLAYAFKSLNNDESRGKTRSIDLQSHIYKRTLLIDIFAQLYTGFYLTNTQRLSNTFSDSFYLRPDVSVRLFGITGYHLFNGNRFSYAAPFVQNEIQEKSAGSFLLGGRIMASSSHADSSYLPFFVSDSLFEGFQEVRSMSTFQFGPGGGYAYSLIVKKRVFLTASFNLAFMVGPVRFWNSEHVRETAWQLNPVLGVRLGFGYNSPKWYTGITFLQEGTSMRGIDNLAEINISGGDLRLTMVKRFQMGPKLKEKVDRFHR